ncbi:hypothetical protein CerSpe_231100 [Prunus speciosa]
MERQKHKLVATATCEGEGPCRGRLIDKLSHLPDHIAHRILSFLSMHDLARLSCVSKCCRELCLSSPFLNFSKDDCGVAADTCGRKQRLLNSLERFFLLRGYNNIQRLHLEWRAHSKNQKNQSSSSSSSPCVCPDVYVRVISWVDKAVRCNLEELKLILRHIGEPNLIFPSFLFLCGSLKSLCVHMKGILKTPSSFLSNLKYLELLHVVIEDDEGFFKWISCSCIRILRLAYPRGLKNINIESSSLEIFNLHQPRHGLDTYHISCENLQQLSISLRTDSSSITSLNIFAPNLKTLWWVGNLTSHPNLGKFQSLEYAKVEFDSVGTVYIGKTLNFKYTSIILGPRAGVDDFDPLCEVFRSYALTLKESVIKVMFKLKGSMPVSFENVRRLRIDIGSISDDVVPPMVSLFRRMPNLYDLDIRRHQRFHEPTSYKHGFLYWKLHNLEFINQLESLTTELLDEFNEVEFARYILECAQKLTKFVIICSPQNLEEVKRKLEKSKMISKAAIVFKEDRKSEQRQLFDPIP